MMRRIITTMLALVVLLGLAAAAPVTATASTVTAQACAKELGLQVPSSQDAKAKTPVVLVHGLWSKAEMWREGNPSMTKVLQGISQIEVSAFDYDGLRAVLDNIEWVS